MPNFSKFGPPTLKNSKSDFFFIISETTSEANLSPEGSPVRIKIFFILLQEKVYYG